MSKWKHRLSSINEETRTAYCDECGPTTIRPRQRNKNGTINWRCNQTRWAYNKGGYRIHLGEMCERCGFIPEIPAQLDVHHKDKDRRNNSTDNLVTLCANCHRFIHHKTHTLHKEVSL